MLPRLLRSRLFGGAELLGMGLQALAERGRPEHALSCSAAASAMSAQRAAAASIEACHNSACRCTSRSAAWIIVSAMRRMATTWPSGPAEIRGNRPANSSSTRRSTRSNSEFSARSTKKWTNINTIDSARARAVVSNFRPKPFSTLTIDLSGASRSTPFRAIVMPITVPKKPRIGIAHTITRNRP